MEKPAVPPAFVHAPLRWGPSPDHDLLGMRALPATGAGQFLRSGSERLDHFLEAGIRSLPRVQREEMGDFLHHGFGSFRMGSLCSGTDSSTLVARSFWRAVHRVFGAIGTAPTVAMQCESCPKKQALFAPETETNEC